VAPGHLLGGTLPVLAPFGAVDGASLIDN